MSTLALALFVTALLSRLPLLLLDRPIRKREAALSWALQGAAFPLLVQGRPGPALGSMGLLVLLGLAHALCHGLWWRGEQRRGANLQRLRLGTTLALFLLAALVASPWSHLTAWDHRPWLLARSVWFSPLALAARLPWHPLLVTLTGYLLCVNEANALIRWVIERMSLRPREAPSQEGTPRPRIQALSAEQAEVEYKRGRLIGVLERSILFALVLGSQYTALAFVLTAKAMARFKSLDDRNFAEYFLLGTLLSVVLAGAAALAVKGLLGL